ncbi:MAG: serpin family protein [Bradymonadaceae bacterium]
MNGRRDDRATWTWLTAALASALALAGCGSADGGPGGNGDGGGGGDIQEIRSSKQRISNPSVSSSTLEKLTADNADFAFDLYDELAAEQEGENFFYSPHSMSTALAMTYAGAEGSSESEMERALHFKLPEKKLHPAFNKLDLTLEKRAKQSGNAKKGKPFDLNVANSIWGQRGYPFEQPFLRTLARHYGAGLRTVNFRERPNDARKAINKWVEKKTENRIKDLLPRGSILRSTRLVLTNAIYFNASWAAKFDEKNTSQGTFTTASGKPVQVPMMAQRTQKGFAYAEGKHWRAVELPYVGKKVSMVVLVPDAGSFAAIEQKLAGDWLNRNVFAELSQTPVDLKMPKFEFKSKFSVKKMLKALGMKVPFVARSANFSGIAKGKGLFIQDVIHQSFVSVDEKGTEAAAATDVTVGTTSVPEFEKVRVDRPFVFMIRDRETNAVIFAGRVLDPS